MSLTETVVSLLHTGGWISFGDLLRLSRCDRSLWTTVNDDVTTWRAISQMAQWKRLARSREAYEMRRIARRCCRECGVPRSTPMLTGTEQIVFVCMRCRQSPAEYSEVVTRQQIKDAIATMARTGWVAKYASVVRAIVCWKRTRTGAFLYWREEAHRAINPSIAWPHTK